MTRLVERKCKRVNLKFVLVRVCKRIVVFVGSFRVSVHIKVNDILGLHYDSFEKIRIMSLIDNHIIQIYIQSSRAAGEFSL